MLAFSAIRNNDKVGLVLFTDRVEKFIPPKKGRRHALRVIRDLLDFKPESRGTSLAAALSFIGKVQRRRAVVFLFERPRRPATSATSPRSAAATTSSRSG